MLPVEIFSPDYVISYVRPLYLWIFFLAVLVIVFIFSKIIIFHLNKYKEYSPLTNLAQKIFNLGMIILYILAVICVILYTLAN
jgi:hypothetical protein